MQSQKDLFCIFPTSKGTDDDSKSGSKSSSTDGDSSEAESKDESTKPEKPQMVTVESKLSIEDYFKQKMKNRMQKAPQNPESSTEVEGDAAITNQAEDTQPDESTHKRKKKKHKSSN